MRFPASFAVLMSSIVFAAAAPIRRDDQDGVPDSPPSTGWEIAIAVVLAVVVLGLIATAYFIRMRKRQRRRNAMFVTTLASAEDLDYSREEVRPKSSLSTVDDHILAQPLPAVTYNGPYGVRSSYHQRNNSVQEPFGRSFPR
ncbi:hypothetical protein AcW1_005991 [Taiwanofungus camphoratus]|nr:hypothetical protein AcW2_004745 [Antrodia cinnamomea]KAI0934480.1 hypothetical protein AcV5_006310 [Antrodia cinnamomea]KAI0950227.1 hypothetical protein AcV7_008764 [Antrodia cinnamomea]KAI0957681.1 hypothetical protein AcW1_005991 [Antrodia cinnamomea]